MKCTEARTESSVHFFRPNDTKLRLTGAYRCLARAFSHADALPVPSSAFQPPRRVLFRPLLSPNPSPIPVKLKHFTVSVGPMFPCSYIEIPSRSHGSGFSAPRCMESANTGPSDAAAETAPGIKMPHVKSGKQGSGSLCGAAPPERGRRHTGKAGL